MAWFKKNFVIFLTFREFFFFYFFSTKFYIYTYFKEPESRFGVFIIVGLYLLM